MHHIEERGAFRAKRATIGRVIGVALDVDDVRLLTFRKVALGIHDDAAGDRAIGAGIASFRYAEQLEGANRRSESCFNSAETKCAEGSAGHTHAGAFHE